jgi:hypothetical protein
MEILILFLKEIKVSSIIFFEALSKVSSQDLNIVTYYFLKFVQITKYEDYKVLYISIFIVIIILYLNKKENK